MARRQAEAAPDQLQEFKAAFGLFAEGKEKLDAGQLDRTLKKFGV